MDIETRLRADLADRATEIAGPPPGLYEDVLVGSRRQQRQRRGVLAAGLCAVVAAVAVPLAVGGATGTGTPVGPDSSAPGAREAGYVPYGVAPRGSLAGDAAYVDALLTRSWSAVAGDEGPPLGTRHVVFAGEIGGGVSALVIGFRDGHWTALELRGPAGAAPADLVPAGDPQPVDPDGWLAMAAGGTLVVLGRPGDAIEVSPRQDVGADGVPTSVPYQRVGDGTGVAVLDTAGLGAASLRITRAGVVVYDGPLASGQAAAEQSVDGLDLGAAVADAAGSPDPALVRQLVVGALSAAGVSPAEVAVDVLWGGPIGDRGRPAEAAVVSVALPSGPRVLAGGMAVSAGGDGERGTLVVPCLRMLLPPGTEPAAQVVSMRCDLFDPADGTPLGSRLVVVPPAGTASVRLTGASGSVLDEREVQGPVSVGAAPEGITAVTALDASGSVVAQSAMGRIEGLPLD